MEVQEFVVSINGANGENGIVDIKLLDKIDCTLTKSRGIIAGIGVACIAIVADHLINRWA